MDEITNSVLSFWFGGRHTRENNEPQAFWFKSTDALDQEIKQRFAKIHEKACGGQYDRQANTSDDHLAMVLVLDQFPRNMFRDTPNAFASDPLALRWSRRAIDRGFDLQQSAPHRRMFLYLPFEHSENLEDQERAVDLMATVGGPEYLRYAHLHRDVIARFHRFPHRNRILQRRSRPDEEAYLSKPGAGF